MPFRRKKAYKSRRKPRRRTKRVPSSTMVRQPSLPIGKRFKFQTRYVEYTGNLDPGAGTPANYVYRLSSLFDPNFTGIGGQPIGFDQIMPLYDHFVVTGCTATVKFVNEDAVNASLVTLQIKDTGTTSTSTDEILENGNCVWNTLGTRGSQEKATLKIKYNANRFFSKKVTDDDEHQGTIAANPAENAFLHIHARPLSGNDAGIIRYVVQLDYTALLTEPKQLVGS